jgi:hypothetical protein
MWVRRIWRRIAAIATTVITINDLLFDWSIYIQTVIFISFSSQNLMQKCVMLSSRRPWTFWPLVTHLMTIVHTSLVGHTLERVTRGSNFFTFIVFVSCQRYCYCILYFVGRNVTVFCILSAVMLLYFVGRTVTVFCMLSVLLFLYFVGRNITVFCMLSAIMLLFFVGCSFTKYSNSTTDKIQ